LRNILAEHYLYLARIIAKRFSNRGVEYDDLLQVASLSLLKALERFDCTRGIQFVSFASPTIAGEVRNYFRDKAGMIRLPRLSGERYIKVRNAKQALTAQLGREPAVMEIARRLSLAPDDIVDALEANSLARVVSLDEQSDDEDARGLAESVGVEEPGYDAIADRDALIRAFSQLSAYERKLLAMRVVRGMSQREVAKAIGASQMQVSRLERRLLTRLQEDIIS
jgi:RNA polymerase sigma-B factor